MSNSVSSQFRALRWNESQTYLFAAIFVLGNIVLPQLCHLMPQGGLIFLPIYFFTLIGAYMYGWQVGVLTAVASPLLNSLLFGMPPAAALPVIIIKSVLLALSAAFIAHRYDKVSIPLLLMVVLLYQVVGSLVEALIKGSFFDGFQDFRLGIPGMLLQVFAGYFVIKWLSKK